MNIDSHDKQIALQITMAYAQLTLVSGVGTAQN